MQEKDEAQELGKMLSEILLKSIKSKLEQADFEEVSTSVSVGQEFPASEGYQFCGNPNCTMCKAMRGAEDTDRAWNISEPKPQGESVIETLAKKQLKSSLESMSASELITEYQQAYFKMALLDQELQERGVSDDFIEALDQELYEKAEKLYS